MDKEENQHMEKVKQALLAWLKLPWSANQQYLAYREQREHRLPLTVLPVILQFILMGQVLMVSCMGPFPLQHS